MKKDEFKGCVGVFDSGVGGISILRGLVGELPHEQFVYFGDSAHAPYGEKTPDEVLDLSRGIVDDLVTAGCKAIVIACNTATALAIDEVSEEAGMPVIGVVEPGARMAAESTRNGKVGVIATRATIHTHAYSNAIRRINPDIRVFSQAGALLVPLVEEGWVHDRVTDEIIMRYLDDLLEHGIDTLILGCTHYPLLRSEIRKLVGDEITLINPAYETAKELGRMLACRGLESTGTMEAGEPYPYKFFVSDDPDKFTSFANSILPVDVKMAKIVPIEEY